MCFVEPHTSGIVVWVESSISEVVIEGKLRKLAAEQTLVQTRKDDQAASSICFIYKYSVIWSWTFAERAAPSRRAVPHGPADAKSEISARSCKFLANFTYLSLKLGEKIRSLRRKP